ncbi:MAG: LysR family transcriptional regulator, partial [Desulfobulbia bacterium]
SKTIARIEDRLRVRLLHRTTRKLALTAEGEKFHLRAVIFLRLTKTLKLKYPGLVGNLMVGFA